MIWCNVAKMFCGNIIESPPRQVPHLPQCSYGPEYTVFVNCLTASRSHQYLVRDHSPSSCTSAKTPLSGGIVVWKPLIECWAVRDVWGAISWRYQLNANAASDVVVTFFCAYPAKSQFSDKCARLHNAGTWSQHGALKNIKLFRIAEVRHEA